MQIVNWFDHWNKNLRKKEFSQDFNLGLITCLGNSYQQRLWWNPSSSISLWQNKTWLQPSTMEPQTSSLLAPVKGQDVRGSHYWYVWALDSFTVSSHSLNYRQGYITKLILGLRPANETALLCNDVCHWLGASLESGLYYHCAAVDGITDSCL